MKNYKLMIGQWVRSEVENWFADKTKDLYTPYYLWYKESEPGNNGVLKISAIKPSDEWFLAGDGEQISIGWTIEEIVYRLCEWCSNLPILDPCE